jgi:hypothetical protein
MTAVLLWSWHECGTLAGLFLIDGFLAKTGFDLTLP